MKTKATLIQALLLEQNKQPAVLIGEAFAPSNIALVKYWGKRDTEFNLPITGSLSISLGEKGAFTQIRLHPEKAHLIHLNGNMVPANTQFYQRLSTFLNLIKPDPAQFYQVNTTMNLPVAAGLASSACGFAAVVKAFANLYAWSVPEPILSILCRMGSGSACRSLWQGFVEWHAGERDDGLDSFAEPLPYTMPDLAIGLCILTQAEKAISSREAMNATTRTSILYEAWPKQVATDLSLMRSALQTQDFQLLGQTAERNALAMHATMLASTPAVCYFLPETLRVMQQVWQLRQAGVMVYFTEDAGPNLKLLAKQGDVPKINTVIANLEWIQ